MARSGEFVVEAQRRGAVDVAEAARAAEMPIITDQQIPGDPGFFEQRLEAWRTRGNNEGGFIIIDDFLASYAGQKVAKHVGRHKGIYRAGAVGAVFAMASMIGGGSFDLSASANMNEAHTSANIYKIAYGKGVSVAPPTMYFEEREKGQGIKEVIEAKACSPNFLGHTCLNLFPQFLDPQVNLQLDGVGQEQLMVPLDAIQAWKNGDKIDVNVNLQKVKANISWVGAGPLQRWYTMSGNTQNFGDQQGFRKAWLTSNAEQLRVVNLDKLGNTLDGLDSQIEHDESQRGLDAMGQCTNTPEYRQAALPQIKNAVLKTIKATDAPDVANFKFTHVISNFQTDTGQAAAAALNDQLAYSASSYELPSGKYQLDNLNCGGISQAQAKKKEMALQGATQ